MPVYTAVVSVQGMEDLDTFCAAKEARGITDAQGDCTGHQGEVVHRFQDLGVLCRGRPPNAPNLPSDDQSCIVERFEKMAIRSAPMSQHGRRNPKKKEAYEQTIVAYETRKSRYCLVHMDSCDPVLPVPRRYDEENCGQDGPHHVGL